MFQVPVFQASHTIMQTLIQRQLGEHALVENRVTDFQTTLFDIQFFQHLRKDTETEPAGTHPKGDFLRNYSEHTGLDQSY